MCAQFLLQFSINHYEALQACLRWSVDLCIQSDHFCQLFTFRTQALFRPRYKQRVQKVGTLCNSLWGLYYFETVKVILQSENIVTLFSFISSSDNVQTITFCAQLLLQFCINHFGTLHVFWTQSENFQSSQSVCALKFGATHTVL